MNNKLTKWCSILEFNWSCLSNYLFNPEVFYCRGFLISDILKRALELSSLVKLIASSLNHWMLCETIDMQEILSGFVVKTQSNRDGKRCTNIWKAKNKREHTNTSSSKTNSVDSQKTFHGNLPLYSQNFHCSFVKPFVPPFLSLLSFSCCFLSFHPLLLFSSFCFFIGHAHFSFFALLFC